MTGTDCSDGLARCTGGTVEVSRAAHIPSPCIGSPEHPAGAACVCPWDVVGRCETRCAVDGLEIASAPSSALERLCVSTIPITRPALPTDPRVNEICASEGLSCVEGLVRLCDAPGRPSRAIATCLFGCVDGVALDSTDVTFDETSAAILCRRGHIPPE